MKKILLVIICLILLVGCGKKKEESNTKITLDINPSLEIVLKEDKVESINALNDDAKNVLDKDLKGETLEEALKYIMTRSIELDYIDRDQAVVLAMIDGDYEEEDLRRYIGNPCGEQNIPIETIIIDSVTKEDEEFAKSNNISVAKAHYINELAKERNVNASDYVNKSIREIRETKNTGMICEKDYKLEGDTCVKEVAREKAKEGKVCPDKYEEYKGKCYRSEAIIDTDEYKCREGKLEGDKCILESTYEAIPSKYSCSSGELKKKSEIGLSVAGSGDDGYVCADYSKAKEPTLRCLENPGHIMINGKCYNGPAPTINGGCPNGDTLKGGKCYSLDSYDQYVCPDGRIYHKSQNSVPEKCPDTIKTTKPTVTEYKCEGNDKLEGTKCIKTEERPAERVRTCQDGYKLIDESKCINESDTKEKVNGYYCDKENSYLEGDTCVILERIEANRT